MNNVLEKQVLDLWRFQEPDKTCSWIAKALGVSADDVRRIVVRWWARQQAFGWDYETKES